MHDAELQIAASAVVRLLQRHIPDDRLCCNDERYITVVRVDSNGFVTLVKCMQCQTEMETKCHSLKWTYNKISELSQLKAGDHICWHRCYAIWHHAIVTKVNSDSDKLTTVEYTRSMKVKKKKKNKTLIGCCETLYRVNYQECYGDRYTVLRAKKLVNEDRYNLAERNCEHFSRWCKTGRTSSSQISIMWTSAGKAMLALALRLLMLFVLGLLEYLHESQEDKITKERDREWLEAVQLLLTFVYIAVMNVVFIAYLLKTSGSHLPTVRRRRDEQQWCCRPSNLLSRYICCILCTCCCVIRRIVCCFCDNVKCGPTTCCRRPAHLACGLFIRIVVREQVAAICTLMAIWLEELITNANGIRELIPLYRTGFLLLAATIAHLVGYLLGACLGRWFEACYCCCCCCCCCE